MAKKKTSKTTKRTKKNTKDIKKELKNIEEVGDFNSEFYKKFFIVLIIITFICLFYLLTVYITNKHSEDDGTKTDTVTDEATISYDEIIVGRSLSMSEDEYFVLFYDYSDEEIASSYEELASNYKSSGRPEKLYTVDMSSAFNKKYVGDGESNKDPQSIEDFKIVGPTLIKVFNHEVREYIEDEEEINEMLK